MSERLEVWTCYSKFRFNGGKEEVRLEPKSSEEAVAAWCANMIYYFGELKQEKFTELDLINGLNRELSCVEQASESILNLWYAKEGQYVTKESVINRVQDARDKVQKYLGVSV